MTGGSGSGRWQRFTEFATSLGGLMTGVAALLTAVVGILALHLHDGNPTPAPPPVTITVPGPPEPVTTPTAPLATAPTTPPTTTPTTPQPPDPSSTSTYRPPAPSVQYHGQVRVESLGETLSTVPPTRDQTGDPDIAADTWGGTLFASRNVAKWAGTGTPSEQQCADLILAQGTQHLTGADGDRFCVRVAQSPFSVGSQYAFVTLLGQGRDASNFPWVSLDVLVWSPLT